MEQESTRNWIIATSIFFGGTSLVFTFPALIASIMMSDTVATGVGLLIFSVLSLPALSLISILWSWSLYRAKNYTDARYVSLLPLISGLFFVVAWAMMKLDNEQVASQSEQVNRELADLSECTPPVLDGGDGLDTTGCGMLKFGVRGGGITSSTLEAHNWQFFAKRGKRVMISLPSENCTTIVMKFLDSHGERIKTIYVPIPSCGNFISGSHYFDPPADGTYILRIETPENPSIYSLVIWEVY